METKNFKYISQFIDEKTAKEYFPVIKQETEWAIYAPSRNSRLVNIFPHEVQQFIGISEYLYKNGLATSDLDLSGLILLKLASQLIMKEMVVIEGIFLNYYKNGSDYCPMHSDTYGEDRNISVYTLSLGCSRDFLLKKNGKGNKSEKIKLNEGDLYFMSSELQKTHKHSIPKRKKVNEERISVVFFTTPIVDEVEFSRNLNAYSFLSETNISQLKRVIHRTN